MYIGYSNSEWYQILNFKKLICFEMTKIQWNLLLRMDIS